MRQHRRRDAALPRLRRRLLAARRSRTSSRRSTTTRSAARRSRPRSSCASLELARRRRRSPTRSARRRGGSSTTGSAAPGPARPPARSASASATSRCSPAPRPTASRPAPDLTFDVKFANQGENDEGDVKVRVRDHRRAASRSPPPGRSTRRRPGSPPRSPSRSRQTPPIGTPTRVQGDHRQGRRARRSSTTTSRPTRPSSPGSAAVLSRRRGRPEHDPGHRRARGRGPRVHRASCSPSSPSCASCGGCAPRSASSSATATRATSSTHAAELERAFSSLHDYVEDVAARLDGRLGEAEHRLDGAIAYRGLVRYDAYNEMSGRQSTSIALLDASRSGVVLQLDPPPRPGAGCTPSRSSRASGELELSPEEAGGGAHRRLGGPAADLMRARLPRPGGHVRAGGAARVAGALADGAELVAARRRCTTRSSRCSDGDGRPRRRADRELASRARSTRRSTRSRSTRPTSRSSARSCCPVRHCLIARAGRRARGRHAPCSPTRRRTAQCARFLREQLPARRRRRRRRRPPRRCARSPGRRRAVGGASAPRWPPSSTARSSCARRSRTSTSNATRFVWLARDREPWPPPAGDAALKTSIVVRRRGRRLAGLARALPVGVRVPRREPDADRVAAARGRLGHYLFLVDARRAATTTAPVAEAVAGAARPLRGGPRLGSYRRRRRRWDRPRAPRLPVHSAPDSSWGPHATRPTGVHAARRAPAAWA